MDNKFTPEQIEKLKACKSKEEIAAFAKENGSELSDEELEKVSGGEWADDILDSLLDKLCNKYRSISWRESQNWTENGHVYSETRRLEYFTWCEKCEYKGVCKYGIRWTTEYRQKAIELGWKRNNS